MTEEEVPERQQCESLQHHICGLLQFASHRLWGIRFGNLSLLREGMKTKA